MMWNRTGSSSTMAGPSKLITFVKRYGTAARFAAEAVLPWIAPAPVATLCLKVLEKTHEAARDEFDLQELQAEGFSKSDLEKIESVVAVLLDGKLGSIVEQIAQQQGQIDSVEKMLGKLLRTDAEFRDAYCEATRQTDRIIHDGFDRVEAQQRRMLEEQQYARDMLEEFRELLQRVAGRFGPIVEELHAAVQQDRITDARFVEGLELYRVGVKALLDGSTETARSVFGRLSEIEPKSSSANVALAYCSYLDERWRAGDRQLSAAVSLRPHDPELTDLRNRVTGATQHKIATETTSENSDADEIRIGDTLGDWKLEARIGRGGMGLVFKATDGERVAALKVLQTELAGDSGFRRRFRKEILALSRIAGHPNLVEVIDFGDEAGRHFFVMEFIDGETLERRLARQSLGLEEILDHFRGVAAGLAEAHRAGIVHGDVKPSNMMVRADGTPVLIDFGLARRTGGTSVHTVAGPSGLTHEFASPEQLRGERPEPVSDVYSLAASLYYCLTYQTPEQRRVDRYHPRHVPEGLRELLTRSLRRTIDEPPQDAVAFLEAYPQTIDVDAPVQQPERQIVTQAEQIIVPTSVQTDPFEGTQAGQERSDNGLQMAFCWCPPGKFRMGSPPDEPNRYDDEDQVEVTLSHGFWLGKYPVTQQEYEQIMGNNPSKFSASGRGKDKVAGIDTSRFPVESVSWEDAMEFFRKLTEQERGAGRLAEGWKYTLPTEAQWEYACRAGTTTAYWFGSSINAKQANFEGKVGRPTPVGSYPSNGWGLYDTHGNVLEWCLDKYAGQLSGGMDPSGPVTSADGVFRGGSWGHVAQHARAAYRLRNAPSDRGDALGFRGALVQEPS